MSEDFPQDMAEAIFEGVRRQVQRSVGQPVKKLSGCLRSVWPAKPHPSRSTGALDSERVRSGLKSIQLGPAGLYEALRLRGETGVQR